jgi:hypothetical protein
MISRMPRRAQKLICSKLRLAATRAVLVLAAVAVLLSVVRGGTRFFYCPITHMAFDAPPCSSPRDEADDSDAPAVRTADCCQEKWRAAAPAATIPEVEETSVAAARLVAVVGHPRFDIAMASAKVPFGLAHAVRAGPPPPSAGKRRAQLMIFHI